MQAEILNFVKLQTILTPFKIPRTRFDLFLAGFCTVEIELYIPLILKTFVIKITVSKEKQNCTVSNIITGHATPKRSKKRTSNA